MPRPGALEHAGQLIVGGAVKRVSDSRTGCDIGKIQQSHEVYPKWLRHRVSPPKRDSMPVFMQVSTSAYLLLPCARLQMGGLYDSCSQSTYRGRDTDCLSQNSRYWV